MKKEKNDIYVLSTILLTWVTWMVIVTSLLFLFGIKIGWYNIALATLFTTIFIYLKCKEVCSVKVLVSALAIVIICILFSSVNYDTTYDGACYHKQAVGLLKEGWNPVYYSAQEYNMISQSIPSEIIEKAENALTWAETYPKASWYFASCIYFMTNNIESGKAYNILFILILFGISYSKFYVFFNSKWKALIASTAIALNPIALDQIQCYYVDGACACILMALMIELVSVIEQEWENIEGIDKLNIILLIIWGCNLKFSITLFTGIFCIAFFVFRALKKREKLAETFKYFLYTAIFSGVIVGFAPYMTNIIRYHNVLAGYTLIDTSDSAINEYFGISGLNRVERSLCSLFGKMSHGQYHSVKELIKIPFTIEPTELNYYVIPDTRVSAFGVWFSGIFLISIVICIIFFVRKRKLLNDREKLIIVFASITLIELFAFTTSYQMRYVPHLYFITIMALVILLNVEMNKKVLKKIMVAMLFAAMIFNVYPWIKRIYIKQSSGIETHEELRLLATHEQPVIAFHAYDFNGMHYNLKDCGIDNYVYVDKETLNSEYKDVYSTYENWVFYTYDTLKD